MKYLIFVLACLAFVALGFLLRDRSRAHFWIVGMIAALPFVGLDPLDINLISYEHYRGDARGIEVTLVDLLCLTLIVALPPRRSRRYFRVSRAAYLAAVLLSVGFASQPLFSLFSVWKIIRMYVLFDTLTRACEDPRAVSAIMRGFAVGIGIECFLALEQRYLYHMHQVKGNLPHPNTLGMVVNMVTPALFAFLLAKRNVKTAAIVVGAAALTIIMTLSRGAMVTFALGCSAVFAVSSMRRPTAHKAGMALLGALAAAGFLWKAWDSIVDRFLNAPETSEEARELFIEAAKLMLKDAPWGVGMNQFSHTLEHGGYALEVGLRECDRSGIIHHLYWLTAVETGWVGLASFGLVLASPVILGIRHTFKSNPGLNSDVIFGLTTGLCAMYLQSTLEWAARQTTLSYLFWIVAAAIVGLSSHSASRR